MRRLITLATAAVLVAAVAAEGAVEKKVDAPIKQVTVYPDRAQVTRQSESDLAPGEYTLIIEGLPGGVIDASLRASVSGVEGVSLQRLSHRRQEHLKAQQSEVAALEAQIVDLERHRKQVVSDRLETLIQLRKFVAALGESVTKDEPNEDKDRKIEVADWTAAYAFIGSRSFNLGDSIRQTRQELEDIDAQVRLLRSNLSELTRSDQRFTKSARVDVKLELAGKVRLTLEYIIMGAGWVPMYDARIQDDPDQVTLVCHAEVSQRTGEDWKDVELTLSTARPSLGAGPGELRPWLLAELPRPKNSQSSLDKVITVEGTQDILDKFVVDSRVVINQETIRNRPAQTVTNLLENVAGVRTTADGEVYVRGGRGAEAAYVVDGVVPPGMSNPFPTVFKIKRLESISSGGETARVTVAEWILKGRTRLICRPRIASTVFRLVSVTNQDETPLLPGDLSVFAGTNFLGRTRIEQTIATSEECEMPFGPDNEITVERKMVAVKKIQKGSKIRQEQTVRINLQNHGAQARIVNLEELRPVSQDSRIDVKIGSLTPSPVSQDEDGLIKWEVNLGPGAEVVVNVPYEISYPSGLQVMGM